jgi:hypothetical protein
MYRLQILKRSILPLLKPRQFLAPSQHSKAIIPICTLKMSLFPLLQTSNLSILIGKRFFVSESTQEEKKKSKKDDIFGDFSDEEFNEEEEDGIILRIHCLIVLLKNIGMSNINHILLQGSSDGFYGLMRLFLLYAIFCIKRNTKLKIVNYLCFYDKLIIG